VSYPFGELDTLVPAFATTIHKSEGSEYPAVVIPIATQHYTMLARNLVYTGVTRGKRLVVVVGQRRALALAVRGGEAGRAALVQAQGVARRGRAGRTGARRARGG
jgi:exodeoxyribonuclease V alpha subunit